MGGAELLAPPAIPEKDIERDDTTGLYFSENQHCVFQHIACAVTAISPSSINLCTKIVLAEVVRHHFLNSKIKHLSKITKFISGFKYEVEY